MNAVAKPGLDKSRYAASALPLALTLGDPAGVGPLITWRTWERRRDLKRPFCIYADPVWMDTVASRLGVQGFCIPVDTIADAARQFDLGLPVVPAPAMSAVSGQPDSEDSPQVVAGITWAHQQVADGLAAAMVTNPINKALLYAHGFSHPGHTEFLAELARGDGGAPRPVMMLTGGGLRVALATIHVPLREVPALITRELLEETATIVDAALRRDFGLSSPRLAFAGLNPHAGESGSLGREEIDVINPAAQALRDRDISISDAQPGDTVFHAHLAGEFDAVIAMYHDQGLAPLKTLDMWNGVNTTLGLPFIRTSPDHGTAYSAAADGSARPDSLIAALNLASDMAEARVGSQGS